MSQPSRSKRAAIVDAARLLFAEGGFHGVTIRQIAAEAQVSPALVIKLCMSKAGLYAEAGLSEVPITDLDLPPSQLGAAYVRRIEQRRRSGAPEPRISPSNTIRNAENPAAERERINSDWVGALAAHIEDGTEDRVHAGAIVCLLVGFAEGLRTIGVAENDAAADTLAGYYGELVQQAIDRAAGE
ncbi:TetR/AcrR family transcriptional regulator [Pseudarthrobacter sp. H2]|uniref:TetR/AcrR family transcriptional regulator n=1 Tax=Pseudarthrobacter sp. H2 TaxID=3418415 RepID=UPI003CEF0225